MRYDSKLLILITFCDKNIVPICQIRKLRYKSQSNLVIYTGSLTVGAAALSFVLLVSS